jgi:hypothetical protein
MREQELERGLNGGTDVFVCLLLVGQEIGLMIKNF